MKEGGEGERKEEGEGGTERKDRYMLYNRAELSRRG